MNHWYTVDQLAAGRRADFDREAAGDVRMRASRLAAGGAVLDHQSGSEAGSWLHGRRPLRGLWSVLAVLMDHCRHAAVLIERRRSGVSDGRWLPAGALPTGRPDETPS